MSLAHPYRRSSFVIMSRRNVWLNSRCDWFRGDETSWLSSLYSASVHNRRRFDDVTSSYRSRPPDHRRRRLVGLEGCLSDVLSHRRRCCTRICWCWSDKPNLGNRCRTGSCWCWSAKLKLRSRCRQTLARRPRMLSQEQVRRREVARGPSLQQSPHRSHGRPQVLVLRIRQELEQVSGWRRRRRQHAEA